MNQYFRYIGTISVAFLMASCAGNNSTIDTASINAREIERDGNLNEYKLQKENEQLKIEKLNYQKELNDCKMKSYVYNNDKDYQDFINEKKIESEKLSGEIVSLKNKINKINNEIEGLKNKRNDLNSDIKNLQQEKNKIEFLVKNNQDKFEINSNLDNFLNKIGVFEEFNKKINVVNEGDYFQIELNNANMINKTLNITADIKKSISILFKNNVDLNTVITLLDIDRKKITNDRNEVNITNLTKDELKKIFYILLNNFNILDFKIKLYF